MVSGAVGAEALAADLSGALARDELRVHYLPTLNLSDGLISGVEATVWNPYHSVGAGSAATSCSPRRSTCPWPSGPVSSSRSGGG